MVMMSPFDSKNQVASFLDALALKGLLLSGCVLYYFWLWRNLSASLLAGGALFAIFLLGASLLEKRTFSLRERNLRERLGGEILLDELLLEPASVASGSVCALLCEGLGAERMGSDLMRLGGSVWLVRCAQCLRNSSAGEGDVLSAHRARIEAGADKCVLVSTGGFAPTATRAGEWVEPPIRLIDGRQLAALAGKLHPATDEEIARYARRRRSPFSFLRIRALALSPAKQRRYLLCAFLLLLLWLFLRSVASLFSCLLSFFLALLCRREKQKESFKL